MFSQGPEFIMSPAFAKQKLDLAQTGTIKVMQEYDASKTYTAWQLCGDWWWVGKYHAKIVKGNAIYQEAHASNTHQTVRMASVRVKGNSIQAVQRYIKWDTPMQLIPIED